MFKTELDWVSAYKKLEAELENANTRIAELEKENAELEHQANALRLRNTVFKVIIKDLLDNSDEYARQRAIDYLKEIE